MSWWIHVRLSQAKCLPLYHTFGFKEMSGPNDLIAFSSEDNGRHLADLNAKSPFWVTFGEMDFRTWNRPL
jgi:hypothetical protein